jgi:type IV pilus assembly protein PilC
MSTFIYQALSKTGENVRGELSDDSIDSVKARLAASGLIPVSVVEQSVTQREFHFRKPKIASKDLVWIARKLASYQKTGIPIQRGISVLASQKQGSHSSKVLSQVEDYLIQGENLADSFAKTGEFEDMFISVLKAGERSGRLQDSLENISDLLAKRLRLRNAIRSALFYPVAVVSFSVLIIIVMVFVLVPQFQSMYAQFNGSLPLPTKIMVSVVNAIKSNLLFVPVVILGLYLLLRYFWRKEDTRIKIEATLLKAPIFGRIVKDNATARIVATLSSLLESGVPLQDAIKFASEVSPLLIFREAMIATMNSVINTGSSFANAIASTGSLDKELQYSVATGEESGTLSETLKLYAEDLIDWVDSQVKILSSLLEPLLVIIIGSIIGTFVITLYLPIFDLVKVIQQSSKNQ